MGNVPVKRRDLGVAGAMVVLSQVLSQFSSTQTISNDLARLKMTVMILTAKVDTLTEEIRNVKVAIR